MKVLGLITEYNPFHNGHKYHLEKSKEITKASHTIAVMSGNFVQRGEPALFDKWDRSSIAIKEGVDLVIELPTIFSCNSAEFFASGSINLLDSLNIVDYICFGSENGNLKNIDLISDLLVKEPTKFKVILKNQLNIGHPFPVARENAIKEYLGNTLKDINSLNSPNFILGIEYLKALKIIKSKIKPFTLKRIKTDYNSTEIKYDICSATAIRKLLEENYKDIEKLKNLVPRSSYEFISTSIQEGKGPIFVKNLEKIFLYKLRFSSTKDLKTIHDVVEGLENRLKKASMICTSYDDLLQYLKTKRYTMTRLKRILIKAILGISKEDVNTLAKDLNPQYIRVLGFNSKGAQLLKSIKESSSLPIITNLKRYNPPNEHSKRMMEIDLIATDIYSLLYKEKKLSKGGYDYIKKPYIDKSI